MKQTTPYRDELKDLHHRRVYYIVFTGILMILLFSLLDRVVAPELFREFLIYRLVAVTFGLVLLAANFRDRDKDHPLIIGFSGYLVVALALMVMIHRMGGTASPYYVGLIIAMTIYSTLAPLTLIQTLVSGFLLIVLYLITILVSHTADPPVLLALFSNLFFMTCFVFIAATQSWADTAARRREFRLRCQENEAAHELARQAQTLEQEVERRSRERTATETRYRLLFNQIADDVAVISVDGVIIQSNRAFDRRFVHGQSGRGRSFYEFVPVGEHQGLHQACADLAAAGRPLANYQVMVRRGDGTQTEAEINGSLVMRNGSTAGILLVIRDIGTRKKLEAKLVESLKVRQQTETAAILALARLSEFKDITPGNHLERIREYSRILAEELAGYPELRAVVNPGYIQDIYFASILHDIGKVSIPDGLLTKAEPLTDGERDLIRRHTLAGGDVIREMEEGSEEGGFLAMARYIAYFHHERWDGSGYPYGLKEREIPLAARIMAVADAYEDLTTAGADGASRAVHEGAVREISHNAGRRFDPMMVGAFVARQQEFFVVRQKLAVDSSESETAGRRAGSGSTLRVPDGRPAGLPEPRRTG